jgi:hypothetical protein
MCLGCTRNNTGHCSSVSSGSVSCVFQAEQLLVPFAGVGKRWLQNWKLKKYKIINGSSKVSNLNFILETNFLLAYLY